MFNVLTSTKRLASSASVAILISLGAGSAMAAGLSPAEAATQSVKQGLVGSAYGEVTASQREIRAAGLRRAGTTSKLTGNEYFVLGSTTKAMTAMVTSRLIERGLLRWDSKIADVIPSLGSTIHAAYRNVTLEQILGHRGGLNNFGAPEDCVDVMFYVAAHPTKPTATLRDRRLLVAEWLLTLPPPRGVTPGVTFNYSNGGYALVGAMIEAVTGKPFETVFGDELLKPLGMSGAFVRPELMSGNQPVGHEGLQGRPAVIPAPTAAAQAWFDVTTPAGLLSTTPDSYATWIRWHLVALKGQATPLPAAYVQRLKKLAVDDYAVGWFGGTSNGRRTIAHNGSWYGFLSDVVIDQSGRQGAFGMTNSGSIGDDLDRWTFDALHANLTAVDLRSLSGTP